MMNIKTLKNKNRQAVEGEAVSNKVHLFPCSVIKFTPSWLKLKQHLTSHPFRLALLETVLNFAVLAVFAAMLGVLHV